MSTPTLTGIYAHLAGQPAAAFIAAYVEFLDCLSPERQEAFADDSGPYPESAAHLLHPRNTENASGAEAVIREARRHCDKWGKPYAP